MNLKNFFLLWSVIAHHDVSYTLLCGTCSFPAHGKTTMKHWADSQQGCVSSFSEPSDSLVAREMMEVY